MKIPALLFVLIVFSAGSASAQSSALAQCQNHLRSNQYDKAVASCGDAARLEPAQGLLGRALAYSGKKDWAAAIKDFSSVLEIDRRQSGVYVYRGGAYQQGGDTKAAVADYERAIALDPRLEAMLRPQIVKIKGDAISPEAKRKSADYDIYATKLISETEKPEWERKSTIQKDQHYTTILETLDLALKANPYNAMAYMRRADVYEKLGKNDLALDDLKRMIESDPQSTLGYQSRAFFYTRHAGHEAALPDITKLIELAPTQAIGYSLRCEYHNKKAAYDLALKDCTVAIDKASFLTSESAMLERAYTYTRQKQYDLALADIAQAAKANLFAADYLMVKRGEVYMAQGKKKEAIAEYRAALKLNAKNADARKALAELGAKP